MEQYLMTRGEIHLPEMYHIETTTGEIKIIFTVFGWNTLLTSMRKINLREDLQCMIPSTTHNWGTDDIFPPVTHQDNHYTLLIRYKDQFDNTKRKSVCRSLVFLFMFLEFSVSGLEIEELERLNNSSRQVQLFWLDTSYREDTEFSSAWLGMSISPEATQFFLNHQKTQIPETFQIMKEHWVKKILV